MQDSKLKTIAEKWYVKYPFLYYAVVVVGVYVVWKLIKIIVKSSAKTDYYADLANDYFGLFYAKIITVFLSLFQVSHRTGMATFGGTEPGTFPFIALDNDGGIAIAYHCLGVTVLVLYNIVLLLLPGSIKSKLKYMLIGSLAIIFVNTIRIVVILFSYKYLGSFITQINHSVLFVILTYSLLAYFHFMYQKNELFTLEGNTPSTLNNSN